MAKLSHAENEKQEVVDFITLLKTMSESEKQQLRGIMIGINLAKQYAS